MNNRSTLGRRVLAAAAAVLLLITSIPALAGSGLSGGGSGSSPKKQRAVPGSFSWIMKPQATKAANGTLESLQAEDVRAAYVAGTLVDLYSQKLFDAEKLSLDDCRMAWEEKNGTLSVEIILWYDGHPFIILAGHEENGQCGTVMGYPLDVTNIEDDTRRFWKKNTESAYCDKLLESYGNRAQVPAEAIGGRIIPTDQNLAVALQLIPDPNAIKTMALNGIFVNETPYEINGIILTDIEIANQKVTCAFSNASEADVEAAAWNYSCYDAEGNRVRSGSFTIPDLPAGQSGIGSMYITSDTVGLLFTENEGAEYMKPAAADAEAGDATPEPAAVPETEGEPETAEEPAAEPIVTAETAAEETEAETEPVEAKPEEAPEAEPAAEEQEPAEEETEPWTAVVNGITVNTLPFKKDGVVLTDIDIDSQKVTCVFSNGTDAELAGIAWHYACYDAEGRRVREGEFMVPDLPVGQSAVGRMYITKNTAFLFFMQGTEAPARLEMPTETAEPETAAEPEAGTPDDDGSRLRETKERDPKQI